MYDTELMNRFSSLNRAMAYCKRYIQKLKQKTPLNAICKKEQTKAICKKQFLSVDEVNEPKIIIIKSFQEQYFGNDINQLRENGKLSKESRLKPLYPFIDSDGSLRVGGRLQNSEFNYDKKHPIIIPYGCKLAQLIIDDAHRKTMHEGNQLTLSQVRHEYWILAAKRAVKTYINNCVKCHRFRQNNSNQLMGSLPSARTKITHRAFTNTGTDLCGPIHLKIQKARGSVTKKGYIVIFVC